MHLSTRVLVYKGVYVSITIDPHRQIDKVFVSEKSFLQGLNLANEQVNPVVHHSEQL